MSLLEVTDLAAYFHTREGVVRAVDGISYTLEAGETLGIVGESGSGKSVSCYSLLGLLPMPPGKIESGTALLDGEDLLQQTPKKLRALRGKKIVPTHSIETATQYIINIGYGTTPPDSDWWNRIIFEHF